MKNINSLRNIIVGLFALLPVGSLNKYFLEAPKKMPLNILTKKMSLPKNIIVFDDFSEKCININNDSIFDTTHGELVSQVIKTELPNSCIKKIDVMIFSNNPEKLRKNNQIDYFLNSKIKYDAANLSVGFSISFSELSERTGIKITKENIALKVKEIKQFFRNNPKKYLTSCNGMDLKMGNINEFYKGMDSLSAKGTKFYVSAANEGPNYLNLVSLVDNAEVIGSVDSMGVKSYSGRNSLVKRFCNDNVKITRVKGGYSINGSKMKVFDDNQVSDYSKEPFYGKYNGTSFSSPRIMVLDLKMK